MCGRAGHKDASRGWKCRRFAARRPGRFLLGAVSHTLKLERPLWVLMTRTGRWHISTELRQVSQGKLSVHSSPAFCFSRDVFSGLSSGFWEIMGSTWTLSWAQDLIEKEIF